MIRVNIEGKSASRISLDRFPNGASVARDRRLLAMGGAAGGSLGDTSSSGHEAMPTTRTGWTGLCTFPNLITMVRLACIPWFLWLLIDQNDRTSAALLLGALGATDWVDGWIARRFDQVSDIGKVLDPTADRLLLVTALLAILADGSIPIWFGVTVLVREALVGLGAIVLAGFGARRLDVTWWGKTGTFALLWSVPCFLAGESTISAAQAFTAGAWIFGLPGLAISWYAAWGYVPAARVALREGRASAD